jgi:signal transduction histidine kinase
VLLVEQDGGFRNRMRAALGSDYHVIEARDVESALGKLLDLVPDLIVGRWSLPEMSAEKLLLDVRGKHVLDGVPILLLTGATDAAQRSRILRSGADDYLLEPFEAGELRARVEKLMTMRRERRQLQRALEANREIAEFLSLLSHELRSPLAAIQLQLELLVRGQGQSRASQEADVVARIARSCSRVSETVELLLHFAGIESGSFVPEMMPLDLVASAAQVIEGLRPRAVAKGLGLQLKASAGTTIRSDAKLVRLLIANLCDTAMKYASEGDLVVSIDRTAEGAGRVWVAGVGPILPEAERKRLFQSSEVLESARAEKRPDVGLRLLLVKRIAGVLGAEVVVEDTADGLGMRLALRFRPGAAP